MQNSLEKILGDFLKPREGFSSKPYWDERQWTWGYGTKVKGSVNDKNKKPAGTITRQQAVIEMLNYLKNDLATINKLTKKPLNNNQLAALLSFSYNLGIGYGIKAIAHVNNNDKEKLKQLWLSSYNVKSDNQNIEKVLKQRRADEYKLFNS